ncbi:MAG: protein kinase [Parachlamydia sp.]|nr:protein kinase [Parachlamydia sp.]
MDFKNALSVAWSDLKAATDANIVKPGQSVLADGLGLVSRLSNYAWMKADTGSWFNKVARKIYHKITEWQEALKTASKKPAKTTHLKSDVRLLGNELGRVIKEKFRFAVDVISRAFGGKPQQIPAKPLPLPPQKKVAELEQRLAGLESERHAEDRDGFHERIFQTSKDLYQLRRALPKKELAKNHPLRIELRRAEKRLEELNPHLPRVRDIVKAKEPLKATLAETVSALCEKGAMTTDDIKRDKVLFSLSTDQEAKALYAKRVVKSGRTGFHLSTVTGIERSWQELKGTTEGVTRDFDEAGVKRHVVFLPQEGEVYLKEQNLKPGSFKVASLATPFFEVKKQEQRGEIAILQPLDDSLVVKEVEAEESPASGSMVILEVEQPKLDVAAEKIVAQERERKDKQKEEFEREANFCRELGKLPGVWPTHKVCTVDGEIAIFQKAAGYRSGENERVIDLDGMQERLKQGKLSSEEQKRYLDMLDGALEGVQSLHDKGIIHRDLKLANMLVSKDGRGYVSDLGTVVHRDGDPEKKIAIGSPSFMSPEVGVIAHLKNESDAWKEVDTAADIWSLGVILWELGSGKDSHEHPSIQLTSEYATDNNVARGTALLAPINPEEIQNDKDREDAQKIKKIYQDGYLEPQAGTLAHLVWRCTRPDPAARPGIDEVREFYQIWSQHAKEKLDRGEIKSIKECFSDEIAAARV